MFPALTLPSLFFALTSLPNFRLTMLNVDSTLHFFRLGSVAPEETI